MILTSIVMLSMVARSAEVAVTDRREAKPAATLPKCVDQPAAIDAIKDSIAANKSKPAKLYLKYTAFEREFASENDVERVARLVYAEATAANCGPKTESLVPIIAGVIGNRVRKRGGNVRSVIYQPDQFASSLNIYDESHYREYLCPKDAKIYGRALEAARRALAGPTDVPAEAVHYFLYKHSPRWTKAPWTFPEHAVADDLRPCLRTFVNPKWN